MNLVSGALANQLGRTTLLAQKASPGILFGAGIVGTVASTVLACRATLKMETVLDETKKKLDTTKEVIVDHPEKYSEKDRRKDVSLIYFQTGVKVARLYGPAIIVGGISIAALTSSHNILTRRNAALTAAYTALDKGFREYRARVVEKYGEEEDRDLRYGTEKVQIVDPDTKKKKTVTRVASSTPSMYARFFDSYSPSWSKEPEYNLIFLKCQQNWANDMLIARGHLFLNEVYDALGLDRSEAGAVVGWLRSDNGETDNFVNFGVFDGKSDRARDFVNAREGAILLDFNVDGVIYDKIDKLGKELSWQLGQ